MTSNPDIHAKLEDMSPRLYTEQVSFGVQFFSGLLVVLKFSGSFLYMTSRLQAEQVSFGVQILFFLYFFFFLAAVVLKFVVHRRK